MNGRGEPELSPAARRLKAVDERFFRFESLLNLVAALVILGIMLLGVAQIASRKLLNLPIPGYIDFIEIVMTLFAFIGLAYTERLGGHIRMEVILGRLKGRTLFALELFGVVLAIVIVAILMWYGFTHFLRAWQIGDTTIDASLPLWPSKLVVPFAFAVLEVRLLIELVGFLRLVQHPTSEQVGVPHIESVEEMAQHELDAGLAAEAEKVDLLGRERRGDPR